MDDTHQAVEREEPGTLPEAEALREMEQSEALRQKWDENVTAVLHQQIVFASSRSLIYSQMDEQSEDARALGREEARLIKQLTDRYLSMSCCYGGDCE